MTDTVTVESSYSVLTSDKAVTSGVTAYSVLTINQSAVAQHAVYVVLLYAGSGPQYSQAMLSAF